jgi:hypothetical protein
MPFYTFEHLFSRNTVSYSYRIFTWSKLPQYHVNKTTLAQLSSFSLSFSLLLARNPGRAPPLQQPSIRRAPQLPSAAALQPKCRRPSSPPFPHAAYLFPTSSAARRVLHAGDYHGGEIRGRGRAASVGCREVAAVGFRAAELGSCRACRRKDCCCGGGLPRFMSSCGEKREVSWRRLVDWLCCFSHLESGAVLTW